MNKNQIFALAYTRTDLFESSESNNHQKESITRYAEENSYTVVQYVEHIDRPGNVFDFEWLTEILVQDQRIKLILVHSSDRFCSDHRIPQKLETLLADKYSIVVDTVIKRGPFSLIN